MASIQRRPDGGWRARYRDHAEKEHARHFGRRVDAQRWLDEVTTSVVSGTYVDPKAGRMTVGAYAEVWLGRQVQLKPTTRATYGVLLRCHVLPAFGSTPLTKVEHSAISAWIAGLVGSASTVRQTYRVLSMVLASAVRDGRLARNPAEGVSLPRPRTAEKRFLTHAQVAALADAAGDYETAIRVLAYCGLRFGELAALRVRNVDPLRRRIVVAESASEVGGVMVYGTPKSGKARSVPVPRSLIDALAAECTGKGPDDFVFTAPEGGALRLRNFRRAAFDRAAQAAGLAGLTPHELRHTAASLAVSSGANVKALQRMLGHASAVQTLDVYADLFDDDLDAVAERLDAASADCAADFLRTSGQIVAFPGGDS